jgi:phosphoglycerol transferase MdoB-like AlkP superfamily enzyme
MNLGRMTRWQVFFRNMQQDLKLYLFVLIVLCAFRVAFIAVLSQYINEATTLKEIVTALYYGIRISLKSTGVITLLSFLFCTLLSVIFVHKNLERVRFFLGCTYISILSVLFNARIPFYQDFHMAFNQFIFNTFKDDVVALGYTLVQQYHLPSRLLASLLIALLFCWLLKIVLSTPTWQLPQFSRWYKTFSLRTGIVLAIALLMVFSRFGGGFTYARSIHWENSTVSRDAFLNEAILDDVQALYRAYVTHVRLQDGQGLNVGTDRIGGYAGHLAGRSLESNNLDDFLRKQAQGAKISKPKHIFIIVGESYAGWPLMPKYNNVNIANGLKSMIDQGHAAYVPAFLPNGTGTMEAMNGMITGLAEVNLSPNYQPGAYKDVYSTAIAPQMKKLGYKTYLWYGGFSSWQRLKEFSLAQGFDQFYASNDMENQSGNAWGSEDKYFLNGISTLFKEDEPSFHIILTTSNHPPYTVDIKQDGFDPASTFGGISEKLKADSEAMSKLGHFWYADRSITQFVQTMYKQYPDSIFIITGDHADRFNIEPNPSLSERYTIPLVIYGQGIDSHLLPPTAAGGQLSIMPTLIELIAPQGFEYYSVVESMTKGNGVGLNRDFWITADNIGKTDFNTMESAPWSQNAQLQTDTDKVKRDIDAVQAVSWWMIKHGKNMK